MSRWAWLLAFSCGETALTPLDSDTAPEVETDTDPAPDTDETDTAPPACEPIIAATGPVEAPIDCRVTLGLSDPVLKWDSPLATVSSTYTVLAGPWADTNADGVVNDNDIPHLFVPDGLETAVFHGGTGFRVATLPVQTGVLADLDGRGPALWGTMWTPNRLRACRPDGCWDTPADLSSPVLFVAADGDRDGSPEIYTTDGRSYTPMEGSWTVPTGIDHGFGPVVHDLLGTGEAQQVTQKSILNRDGSLQCTFASDYENALVQAAVLDPTGGSTPMLIDTYNLKIARPCDAPHFIQTIDGFKYPQGGAIADFDGDGAPELAQVYKGNTEGVRVLRMDGTVVWERDDLAKNLGVWLPTAADLDGDGDYEVLGPGPHVYDGKTGDILMTFDAPAREGYAYLVSMIAVDLDLDGAMEVVVPDLDRVRVYEGVAGWADGPTLWNQWAFSGTNIYPDGTVPRNPIEPWEMHNSFRASAGQTELRGVGSDLVARFVDVCEDECASGHLRLGVQLGNRGTAPILRPVELVVTGVRGAERVELGRFSYPQVEAGVWLAGEDLYLPVTGPWDDLELHARPQGWRLSQCDNTNDVVAWGKPVCG